MKPEEHCCNVQVQKFNPFPVPSPFKGKGARAAGGMGFDWTK